MPSAQSYAYEGPTVRKEGRPRPGSVSFEGSQTPASTTSGSDPGHDRLHRGVERQDHYPPRGSSRNSRNGHPVDYRPDSENTFNINDGPDNLPPLQVEGNRDETLEPIQEDNPASYELVAPPEESRFSVFSLEKRSQQLFSREHLSVIFADPALLLKFTSFLSAYRPQSVPLLIYYLDALKAIRAIRYSNAIAEALEPIEGQTFSYDPAQASINMNLEQKANSAFDALVVDDLPAYIAHQYTQVVSVSIAKRVTGTLPAHLREASEGLAEVFCLTDPSRTDNPIVFASDEFHRTTQYGMGYVLGRNCRFLQGPLTNPNSVRRLRESLTAGKECCEVFLNYRRDGSPFMNLLMTAPLCDSRGIIRYFIGAQVDVSGLVKDCTEMESLERLLAEQEQEHERERNGSDEDSDNRQVRERKDEFEELSEMLNMGELATVRRSGGRMHREMQDEVAETAPSAAAHRPRLLLKEPSGEASGMTGQLASASGKLRGVYQHYLLVRPYPSLRILFASPSQRVPGILQSPFLNKIGGSDRVRQELEAALAEGRGVTAKVRWVTKSDEQGRNKWIHCTPLTGTNGQIGVWMVIIVNDEQEPSSRWRQAPPVTRVIQAQTEGPRYHVETNGVYREHATNGMNGMNGSQVRSESISGRSSTNSLRL